jgi:hypothetical protein
LQTIAAKCLRSTSCLDSCTGTSPAEQALQGVWSLWLTAWSHREDDQGLVVLQRDTSGHRDRHCESTGKDRGQQYRARKDAMTETCGMSRTNLPDWHVDFQIDRRMLTSRLTGKVETWESQVWKAFRLENLQTVMLGIKNPDPRFPENFSWIHGGNLGSWIHKSLRLESRLESDLKPEGNFGYLFLLHLLFLIYWLIYDT